MCPPEVSAARRCAHMREAMMSPAPTGGLEEGVGEGRGAVGARGVGRQRVWGGAGGEAPRA